MKKLIRITLLMETEMNDGDITTTDEFIKKDLCAEISCAWNNYKIVDMETTTLTKEKEGEEHEQSH